MQPEHARRHYRPLTRVKRALIWPFKMIRRYAKRGWRQKLLVWAAAILIIWIGAMYGIAQWYIKSNDHKPLILGVSFIPAYAEYLGLDAKETMDALINDLGVRHFRLVSYWNQLEPVQGQYDFNLLDWQFEKAEAAGAKVTLSIGLRQPRWPECHMPEWAKELPSGREAGTWQSALLTFIKQVVNRYKDSPALASYQLENEYFLRSFSQHCTDFDRQRLIDEYNLVKKLDPYHQIILSRSNNYGIPLGQPVPDLYGISVYRRVWDTKTNRYFQYPLPAWWYAAHAGIQKLLHGKDTILHELQAEAWPPNGQSIPETTLGEQNKSINAKRLKHTFEFGRATGMREIYLWGAEYWYYRMVKLNEPSLWNVAKEEFARAN